MTTPKYEHFKFEDRYTIQEFLKFCYTFTAIGKRIRKDRRSVATDNGGEFSDPGKIKLSFF